MPVYLLHGFRWPRQLIRIHIILQNLEDAASDWLIGELSCPPCFQSATDCYKAPNSYQSLMHNFSTSYPHLTNALPNLRFIEEYSHNQRENTAPYAYVADTVHKIPLSLDIDEIRGRGLSAEAWSAISELRDNLCKDEKLAWYVVVCEDEERSVPDDIEEAPPSSIAESGSGILLNGTSASRDSGVSDTTTENGVMENGFTQRRQRSNSITRIKRMFTKNKDLKKATRYVICFTTQSVVSSSNAIHSLRDLKNPRALHSSHSTIDPSRMAASPSPPPPPIPVQYQNEINQLRQQNANYNHGVPMRPVTQGSAVARRRY